MHASIFWIIILRNYLKRKIMWWEEFYLLISVSITYYSVFITPDIIILAKHSTLLGQFACIWLYITLNILHVHLVHFIFRLLGLCSLLWTCIWYHQHVELKTIWIKNFLMIALKNNPVQKYLVFAGNLFWKILLNDYISKFTLFLKYA